MAFVKAIQTMDLDSNREVETFVDDDKMIANGAAPVSVLTKVRVSLCNSSVICALVGHQAGIYVHCPDSSSICIASCP